MKSIAYAFLFYCLFLASCTRIVYTHNDFMNSIRTKNDAVSTFGSPTSKNSEGAFEVWTYILGSGTIGLGNNSIYGTTNYVNYTREVTIIFDGNDATKWSSRGVDFKKEETDKKKTTWAVLGWTGGTTLFFVILNAII